MRALVLAWRQGVPPVVTRWRGPMGEAVVPPDGPLPVIAAVIGPPGPVGNIESVQIDGGTFA